jgi:allantoin racemase
MKILVINPNTSESLTEQIRGELERIKRPDTELVVSNPSKGPKSIESAYDDVVAAPHVIEMVKRAGEEGYDAVVIACFADTAVDAAKEVAAIPVLGIGEVSLHVAALLGHKFCIVTTLRTRVPAKEVYVRRLGMETLLASVRVRHMEVVEAVANPEQCKAAILEVGRRAIEEDGAEVLILGCASNVGYADDLSRQLGIPVIDPTSVTLKVAEALVDLKLTHSKIGLFSYPLNLERERARDANRHVHPNA